MAETRYLIWSFEHRGWWRPGGSGGYAADFEDAGLFSHDRALEICTKANLFRFNEAMVPLGEHTLDGARATRQRDERGLAMRDDDLPDRRERERRAEHAVNLWLSATGTPEGFLRPAQRVALICEIAEALDGFKQNE